MLKTENNILCIANHKGGVGKTTIAMNLAYVLSKKYKILFIDLDPQSNLTKSFSFERRKTTLQKVLLESIHIRNAICGIKGNIFIIPSYDYFEDLSYKIYSQSNYMFLLKNAIKDCYNFFDFIIIDNPPNIGSLTKNAICASNNIIIPVLPEAFSIMGLSGLKKTFSDLQNQTKFNVLGIVLNMFDGRRKTHGMFSEDLKKNKYFPLFKSKIRINSGLSNAQVFGLHNFNEKNPKGLIDFENLANEILEKTYAK